MGKRIVEDSANRRIVRNFDARDPAYIGRYVLVVRRWWLGLQGTCSVLYYSY